MMRMSLVVAHGGIHIVVGKVMQERYGGDLHNSPAQRFTELPGEPGR